MSCEYIEYEIEQNLNINGIRKLINFASEDIINVEIKENKFYIYFSENADKQMISKKIDKLIKRFSKDTDSLDEIIVHEINYIKEYLSKDMVYKSNLVKDFGNGLISLQNEAILLYNYFDSVFEGFAKKLGAKTKLYPVLLPMESYKKTGYLKTSPQYSIFCCTPKEDINVLEKLNKCCEANELDECINDPNYTLSPAACFHTYMEYENMTINEPAIYTFNQSVFRHEGRLNWIEFGRLKDYHVREVVFIGSIDFVSNSRAKMIDITKQFLEGLNLNSRICVTSDPFVIPTMQKYKKIQIQEESKYEIQLAYSNTDYLATASFNLHGTAFTYPFNIKVKDCENTVTGCVGYGIERWVLAFLSQYGLDSKKWPEAIKEQINKDIDK